MHKLGRIATITMLCMMAMHKVESVDYSSIKGPQYSKFLMESSHQGDQSCIEFSIRVMQSLAEFNELYERFSTNTPNIDIESFHVLKGLLDPVNGMNRKGVSRIMQAKLDHFIPACIGPLEPAPIGAEENEFSKIPASFLSKAMMESKRDYPMDSSETCIDFSIRLMHHLADRKAEYAEMSFSTKNIYNISGDLIKRLSAGLNTQDMKEQFKQKLTKFITDCDNKLIDHKI